MSMSSTLPSDRAGEAATAWAEVFPWIRDARFEGIVPSGVDWERENLCVMETADRRIRLEELCDFIVRQMRHWTLGDVFPGLRYIDDLFDLPLAPRSRNALARQGLRLASEIAGLEVRAMATWINVGDVTMRDILLQISETLVSLSLPNERDRVDERLLGVAPISVLASRHLKVDLATLTSWRALMGDPESTLLGDPLPASAPESVHAARSRIQRARAEDLVPQADPYSRVGIALDSLFNTLEPRDLSILRRRTFAAQPQTLHALAGFYCLSRERVRQLETRARRQIQATFAASEELNLISTTIRRHIGGRLPLDNLLASYPALSRDSKLLNLPAWSVLATLDGSYEIAEGWCAAPTMTDALSRGWAEIEAASDAEGVSDTAVLPPFNPILDAEADRAAWSRWLRYSESASQDGQVDRPRPVLLGRPQANDVQDEGRDRPW